MTETERYAARYRWLRENWDAITGITWSDPIAPKLDEYVDAAMAGVAAADRSFPSENSKL